MASASHMRVDVFVRRRVEDHVVERPCIAVEDRRYHTLAGRGDAVVQDVVVMKLVKASRPAATRAIKTLMEAGVLAETTGKKRDRSFAYRDYLDRLRAGTDFDMARRMVR